MLLDLHIAGKPIPWKRTNVYKGRRLTPADVRAAEKAIGLLAASQTTGGPALGPLALGLEFRMPTHDGRGRLGEPGEWCAHTPDLDNLIKLVGDGLNGVAFKDDRQIVELWARKVFHSEPATVVRLGRPANASA